MTPDQFQNLVFVLRKPYSTVLVLAVLGGLRKGEMEALRGTDIGDGTVIVDEAAYKGTLDTPETDKSNRKVSIGPVVQQALAEWHEGAPFTGPDDFVFSIQTNSPFNLKNAVERHIKPACRRLGIPEVSWHDLRHTYTTWGRKAGVCAEAMRDQLGHESMKTTLDIYSHMDGQDGAAKAIEEYATGGKLLPLSVTPEGRGSEVTQ